MRLDKLLAHAGFGTRKEVKLLLKRKCVTVNDKIVMQSNLHVNPERDEIYVNGEKVTYREFVYLMLNKPQNVITATFDPYDETVIDFVPEAFQHMELSPVGRLDKDTEGFVLLTNDGQLNHRLTSPKSNVWKTYEAKIAGEVTEKHVALFKEGIILDDGYRTKRAKLQILDSKPISHIRLSITEGKFHQVKRMFQAINMSVIYLKRTHIGDVQLDPNLELGECRLLNDAEIISLQALKGGE